MKKLLLLTATFAMLAGCGNKDEMKLQEIITQTENQVKPLNKEAALAYWNGTITGDTAEFEKYSRANIAITKIYSDSATFAALKEIKENGKIKDPVLVRQMEVLYNSFLSNQVDTALLNSIIMKSTALEQKYAEFRASFRGKTISDNEVEKILQTSTDNKELEDVWKAHKEIGPFVAADVVEIIKLRNQVANSLGYDNDQT